MTGAVGRERRHLEPAPVPRHLIGVPSQKREPSFPQARGGEEPGRLDEGLHLLAVVVVCQDEFVAVLGTAHREDPERAGVQVSVEEPFAGLEQAECPGVQVKPVQAAVLAADHPQALPWTP
jgi:hypothetical protein